MRLQNLEQGRHNQNHDAERLIGFLANRWMRQITKKVIPKRLLGFGIVYKAGLLSIMSRSKVNRTGYEEIRGQMPEIGEYLDF